jgi:hypothetical protein
MTTKVLQRPTLILNRNWQPVNVASVALSLPTFYALSRWRVQGNSMGDASVMKAAHPNHLR